MHLDSKQSQFRPGESQRSKNVPDVLFVDEDGNPIEAGAENLIYIDEAGNEVPEELAIRLLESGKYIDSRLLYDDDMIRRSNSYASSGLMGSNSQAIFNASKGSTLGTQSDYQQNSTKHSSSYISKQSNYESKQSSYDSKPSSYATSKRSSSYNTVAQQAQLQSQLQAQAQEMARVQAQLFAEAHAQAQAKAEEIAQIEADAQSNYGGSSTLNTTEKHTPTVTGSKSSSQTTVNRTIAPSTDRRLPTVPPVKKTESYAEDLADFDSYLDDESERKTNQPSNKSSTKHSTQKSSKSSQDKKLSMKEQVAKQKGEIQHGLIKNQLLKKQQELLEQQELERKQQEIIARQQGLQQQQQQKSNNSSRHQSQHHESNNHHHHSNRNEIPSVVSRVSALSATDQRSSRGSGQSRYSTGESTVTGTSGTSSRQQQSSSVNSSRTNQTKQSRISDLSRVSESSRGTDGPAGYVSNNNNNNNQQYQMIINRSASNIKQTPKVTAHIPVPQIPKSSRAASSKSMRPNTAASSDMLASTNQPALKTNREYSNNYDILQMRQVGHLSGNKIIRNFSEANLSELENYYESEEARGLEFEPTNLDIKPNHFIDPFSPDLFKDEIIDIDFGAIDAFTEALNAQISSEKNGTPPPKNLQFPSHILSSNHASFIDNQLLLGDSSINVGGGGIGNVHSGVNVDFLKPSRDSNSYYTSDNTANTASTSAATSAPNTSGTSAIDDSQYSHTNSFGSLIDVQKNRSNSTHDFNTTNRQSVLTSLDNLINTTSSRTASTRYSNSTYVR